MEEVPFSSLLALIRKMYRDFLGSLVVKTSSCSIRGAGSIPGQGIKILHVSQPKDQNIKQKPYCKKFNKDFKNGPH